MNTNIPDISAVQGIILNYLRIHNHDFTDPDGEDVVPIPDARLKEVAAACSGFAIQMATRYLEGHAKYGGKDIIDTDLKANLLEELCDAVFYAQATQWKPYVY